MASDVEGVAVKELLDEDVAWIVRRLPDDVREILKTARGGIFIAGGFLRACVAGEKASDVDLFSETPLVAQMVADSLAKARGRKVYKTDNALTIGGPLPVQFIHRWTFQSPRECVESFDFTIARAAVWSDGTDWHSCCDEAFYPDLAAKRLRYRSPVREEAPAGSMLRILKFYQRGYRIPLDSLADVMGRMYRAIDMDTRLANAPGGIERVLIGMLHEVDPLIDLSHAAHLPASNGPHEDVS
jgi:hypothetical protein